MNDTDWLCFLVFMLRFLIYEHLDASVAELRNRHRCNADHIFSLNALIWRQKSYLFLLEKNSISKACNKIAFEIDDYLCLGI